MVSHLMILSESGKSNQLLELPGYSPGAAYRVVEKLLGRISNLSQTGDFTTQTGNMTGTTPLLKREVYGRTMMKEKPF